MPVYQHSEKKSGDIIASDEWNKMGLHIQGLNKKLDFNESILNGDLAIKGSLSVLDNLAVSNDLSVTGNQLISGSSVLNKDLTVKGNANLNSLNTSTARITSLNSTNINVTNTATLTRLTVKGALSGTAASFSGTVAVGNSLTVNGNSQVKGSLLVNNTIVSSVNNGKCFQSGNDAAIYDVNIANTIGVYGIQDIKKGNLRLGKTGPLLQGSSSKLGINTAPSAPLHVKGNGGVLNLEGINHTYVQFYPQGITNGRKAWFGYGNSNTETITLSNTKSDIALSAKAGAGAVKVSGSLEVTKEIRGKVWYSKEYVWTQGKGPIKMGPVATTVAFLTYVRGHFAGSGEHVRVYQNGSYWYLHGASQKSGVAAKARCIGKNF